MLLSVKVLCGYCVFCYVLYVLDFSINKKKKKKKKRIQINNLPCIFDFFFLDDLILFGTLPATKSCCFFYHQDAVFERNLFHNGHKQ